MPVGELLRVVSLEKRVTSRGDMRNAFVISANDVTWSHSDVLGKGRFGEVLAANWLGMRVSLKKIVPASELVCAEAIRLLREEVAVMSPFLQHPSLLTVFGVISDHPSRSLYLVSRLCHGGSVKSAIRRRAEVGSILPLASIFAIARCTASALAFLHGQTPPIAYRDLSTANMLLEAPLSDSSSDDAHVLLDAEFGVLRHILDRIGALKERTARGASSDAIEAAYKPPELFAAKEPPGGENVVVTEPPLAQPPGDIYSFGMVLYELLSGRAPFAESRGSDGSGVHLLEPQLLACLLECRRPPIPASVPAPLARLIEACWADDPLARPKARSLLEQLTVLQEELATCPQPVAASLDAVRVTLPPRVGDSVGPPVNAVRPKLAGAFTRPSK